MSFRDNLLHLRATNNMTQEQLAMLLGVSRQSVTKWEAEKSYPEMDKLLKMCQIFDCTLDELVQGDLTGRKANATAAAASLAQPADLFGYDESMRRFASKISNGVAAAIAGVAISVFFFGLGDPEIIAFNTPPEHLAVALGVLCIFAGVAVCLALVIPAGMDHSAFVRAHPYLEDFYTADEKAAARKTFTTELIVGILSIMLGICCIIVLGDTSLAVILGIPVFMLFVAVGVRLIVHGGMTMARVDINAYNQGAGEILSQEDIANSDLADEKKAELLRQHKTESRVGAICGIIMILATIIAFVMLFVEASYAFWLAWPIGGLLCGIVALLFKAFGKE